MNNMRIILIVFFAITIGGCSIDTSDIEQIETDAPVILKLDKKNRVRLIQFPIGVKISNPTPLKQGFVRIECLLHKNPYKFESRSKRVEMYQTSSTSHMRIPSNNLKYIPSFGKKEIFIYTIHNIDTSDFYRNRLENYRLKMLESNLDTLAVGSLKEFRLNNKELVNHLLGKDSLVFIFDEFTDKPRFYLKTPIEF